MQGVGEPSPYTLLMHLTWASCALNRAFPHRLYEADLSSLEVLAQCRPAGPRQQQVLHVQVRWTMWCGSMGSCMCRWGGSTHQLHGNSQSMTCCAAGKCLPCSMVFTRERTGMLAASACAFVSQVHAEASGGAPASHSEFRPVRLPPRLAALAWAASDSASHHSDSTASVADPSQSLTGAAAGGAGEAATAHTSAPSAAPYPRAGQQSFAGWVAQKLAERQSRLVAAGQQQGQPPIPEPWPLDLQLSEVLILHTDWPLFGRCVFLLQWGLLMCLLILPR